MLLDVLSIGVGIVVIAVVTRNMFATLFVPYGQGGLIQKLSGVIWRLLRRRAVALAGPLITVSVIFAWVVGIVIGWALIYLPMLPDHFQSVDGVSHDEQSGFWTAVYISLVTLATLGFGDIYPISTVMRLMTPVEALVGFALLTASLTWVLSVYSTLSNQRGLARQVSSLRETERRRCTSMEDLDSQTVSSMYAQLRANLIVVHNDLVQFPVTYYFHGRDERANLSTVAVNLLDIAMRGQEPERDGSVRFQATALYIALENFSEVLANEFYNDDSLSCRDALIQFHRDHHPD